MYTSFTTWIHFISFEHKVDNYICLLTIYVYSTYTSENEQQGCKIWKTFLLHNSIIHFYLVEEPWICFNMIWEKQSKYLRITIGIRVNGLLWSHLDCKIITYKDLSHVKKLMIKCNGPELTFNSSATTPCSCYPASLLIDGQTFLVWTCI